MKTRVLLVDDEKDFVESLSQRLEIRDVDVKTSLSGDEALGLIRENDFDVIVLDVLMPGKDGIETLKEIKTIKPLTHVIMLTGNATVETAIILISTILFFICGVLDLDDLEEIPWNIILLFAGAMSIGFCLWDTGAARWLAVNWLGLLMLLVAFAARILWPLMGMPVTVPI